MTTSAAEERFASCFIGLGANLGEPRRAVEDATERLSRLEDTRILARARIYRSKPIGPRPQAEYFNTAVEIETALPPFDLLSSLKQVEREMGRKEGPRWGPRIIDLDILLYASLQLRTDVLVIPHPELERRRFVLQPLSDLAPELVVPGKGRTIRSLLEALRDDPSSVWLDDTA